MYIKYSKENIPYVMYLVGKTNLDFVFRSFGYAHGNINFYKFCLQAISLTI